MALEQEIKVFHFLHGYGQSLLEGIDAEKAMQLICDGGVNPAWIIGHLALVANIGLQLSGGTPKVDIEAWKPLLGGGSTPTTDASAYPAWDELLAAWHQAHTDVAGQIAMASPEALSQPNPNERMREGLPTVGDLISFMLTSHESMHMGQLSTWRRVQGHAPLF